MLSVKGKLGDLFAVFSSNTYLWAPNMIMYSKVCKTESATLYTFQTQNQETQFSYTRTLLRYSCQL